MPRAVLSGLLLLVAACRGDRAYTQPDGAGTDGTPVACGTLAGMRGLTRRTLPVAGLVRTYNVYLPAPTATRDATTPMPLVFVFHGYTMSGQEMFDITRYAALADSEGIALVFPDGEGGPDSFDYPWNVKPAGQHLCGYGDDASAAGDDLAFVDAMKADVATNQCIDPAHVYASGFSMGAYFSELIGCDRPDFRAIAPHSGGTVSDLSTCATGHVPIILFHGTADSVIDDACDDPTVSPDDGFPAAATLWAAKNGCAPTYSVLAANGSGAGGGLGGGSGTCFVYDACPADGQVELCLFAGMDHCWAGGAIDANGNACPGYADATALQWAFFKRYAW